MIKRIFPDFTSRAKPDLSFFCKKTCFHQNLSSQRPQKCFRGLENLQTVPETFFCVFFIHFQHFSVNIEVEKAYFQCQKCIILAKFVTNLAKPVRADLSSFFDELLAFRPKKLLSACIYLFKFFQMCSSNPEKHLKYQH